MYSLKCVRKFFYLCCIVASVSSCGFSLAPAEPPQPLQTVVIAPHPALAYPVAPVRSHLVQGFKAQAGICGNRNWEPKLQYGTQEQCNRAGLLWYSQHTGIDIAATGVVHIVADGELFFKQENYPGYGNVKVFRHADGNCSLYAHLQGDALWDANHKDEEKQGDPIGLVGSTGAGGVTVLHFAVYRCRMPLSGNGALPAPYLKADDGKHARYTFVSGKSEGDYFCNPQHYITRGLCVH